MVFCFALNSQIIFSFPEIERFKVVNYIWIYNIIDYPGSDSLTRGSILISMNCQIDSAITLLVRYLRFIDSSGFKWVLLKSKL